MRHFRPTLNQIEKCTKKPSGIEPSNLKRSVLGSRFKGYKMLISITIYAIVGIGLFHPLVETWNSTRLILNTIIEAG
jgi:hypothetical protein